MRSFGYEMLKHNPGQSTITFRLVNTEHFDGLEALVTVMYPEKVAEDGKTPAFETEYVVDLINEIMGEHGEIALTILARRNFDS